MFARLILLSSALGLFALCGCGPAKLDETKTYALEPGDTKEIALAAQSKPQTITVEFDSTAGEVTVGVFKDTDAKNLEMVDFAKALKAEKGKKSGSLTVDVPEKTATSVVVTGASKKTEVKVHVTNKK